MIASIQKVLLYKNKSTSIVFGLIGGVYGFYKGIEDYEEYINKKLTANFKVYDLDFL